MSEGLGEYLIDLGWDDDIAEEVQETYYYAGIEGVEEMSEGIGEDELVQAVEDWKKEVREV